MFGKSITTRGAAALALIVLVSCSRDEAAKPSTNAAAAAPPAPVAPATPPAVVSAAQAAPPVPVETSSSSAAVSPGKVLASAEGNLPGTRVDILELKRTGGDSVTLKFALVNDSDRPLDMTRFKGDGYADYRSVSGVYLLDGASKRQYFVFKGADQKCLCSLGVDNVASKARVQVWAKFAAPPTDVQKIGIVVPHFIPVEDVPIAP